MEDSLLKNIIICFPEVCYLKWGLTINQYVLIITQARKTQQTRCGIDWTMHFLHHFRVYRVVNFGSIFFFLDGVCEFVWKILRVFVSCKFLEYLLFVYWSEVNLTFQSHCVEILRINLICVNCCWDVYQENCNQSKSNCRHIRKSCILVFILFQQRNIYNKIFGGFLMRQAFELGFVNACVYRSVNFCVLLCCSLTQDTCNKTWITWHRLYSMAGPRYGLAVVY